MKPSFQRMFKGYLAVCVTSFMIEMAMPMKKDATLHLNSNNLKVKRNTDEQFFQEMLIDQKHREPDQVSDDYDYNYDSREKMKTSPQIVFRPLFRHRQMMEDRKKRAEARRRVIEMQKLFPENGSDYFLRYDVNYNMYLCNKQHCRPATAYDINVLRSFKTSTPKKDTKPDATPNYIYYFPNT